MKHSGSYKALAHVGMESKTHGYEVARRLICQSYSQILLSIDFRSNKPWKVSLLGILSEEMPMSSSGFSKAVNDDE